MSLYGTQRDSDTTKTCKHQYQSAAQKAKAPAQLLLQLTASTKQVTSLPTCIVQAQQSFQEVQQQQQRHCHSTGTEQLACALQSNEQHPFCTLHLALQLLRIETEGAYAGLVAGSPIADDLDSASRSADIQPNASACTLCALASHQSQQEISR